MLRKRKIIKLQYARKHVQIGNVQIKWNCTGMRLENLISGHSINNLKFVYPLLKKCQKCHTNSSPTSHMIFFQRSGVGITKDTFVNFSVNGIFDLAKVDHLNLFIYDWCCCGNICQIKTWYSIPDVLENTEDNGTEEIAKKYTSRRFHPPNFNDVSICS